MKEVNVFVSGCTGNFGRRIVDLVNQHPNLKVCGGFGRKENQYDFPVFDADDFKKTYDFFKKQKPGLIIDVSNPTIAGTIYYYIASDFKIPLVVGTTKLDKSLILHMKSETDIPVFQAYNFLTSMRDFTKRVCDAAVSLPGYDIDIVESHHSEKVDAPSGTAKNLADAINATLGNTHTVIPNADFNQPRGENEIYITSIRRGDDLGTHTVTFACDGEIQEYTHRVTSKDIFAKGAIRAAEFLLEQKPGYYNPHFLRYLCIQNN